MKNEFKKILTLCEDLQAKTHMREVSENYGNVRFSCDLLLRNMIMICELQSNGKDIDQELSYLTNNLLGAHAHLTGEKAINTAQKYNITMY
jgi:hypothetical protein